MLILTKKNGEMRKYTLLRLYGPDGSRTRVQRPIPCPSTIIVNCFLSLTQCFRMQAKVHIRIHTVASYYALNLKALIKSFPTKSTQIAECVGAFRSARLKRRALNYLQRLYLVLRFNAPSCR